MEEYRRKLKEQGYQSVRESEVVTVSEDQAGLAPIEEEN